MKIREDNVTWSSLIEDLTRERVTIKEYIATGEGAAALTTTALNKLLLKGFQARPQTYKEVGYSIQSTKDVKFPNIFGIRPEYIPELSEIPFANADITSTTLSPVKFGIRLGISQEMVDDNEVNLMGYLTQIAGAKMNELYDIEFYKCLNAYHYNTGGGAVDSTVTAAVGSRARGASYTISTATHSLSASAGNWEQIINTALNILAMQTITLGSQAYKYPVYADTIVAHSVRDISLRKLLRSATIIQSTGIGDAGNASVTQVAGSNVWNGALNLVTTPLVAKGAAYILQKGRGMVMLEREGIKLDKMENFAFDAQEVRVKARFMPGMIDERSIFVVALGTA